MLGHALYMKAIRGGKAKSDKIDAHKIAVLLRGGMLPQAYVYPKGMRETRDLLRRRTFLVSRRAEALVHLSNTNSQYNQPPVVASLRTGGGIEGGRPRLDRGTGRRAGESTRPPGGRTAGQCCAPGQ
jgi:hypothetical protein